MNTIKTVISTVALLTASTLFAQSDCTYSWFPKDSEGMGVIGKRYAEVGFRLQDYQQYSDNSTAFGTAANVPLTKNIDVGMSYSYSTLDYSPKGYSPDVAIDSKSHNIGASALLYTTIEKNIKPFIALDLGTSFNKTSFLNTNHDSNSQWWAVSAGAEFPFKWASAITGLSYNDDFKRSGFSGQSWTIKTEINTWITPKVGGYVSLAFVRPMHNYVSSWVWGVGARIRF